MNHNRYRLVSEIVKRSGANRWREAKKEWTLTIVYEREGSECLCGHWPIKEVCVLQNKINDSVVEVGNVCVKRFMGIRADKVCSDVAKVRDDLTRSVSVETVEIAYEKGVLSQWQYNFYLDVRLKRKLSKKQIYRKAEANVAILQGLCNEDGQGLD